MNRLLTAMLSLRRPPPAVAAPDAHLALLDHELRAAWQGLSFQWVELLSQRDDFLERKNFRGAKMRQDEALVLVTVLGKIKAVADQGQVNVECDAPAIIRFSPDVIAFVADGKPVAQRRGKR